MYTAIMKLGVYVFLALIVVCCGSNKTHAAAYSTIDPTHEGNHFASFVHAPTATGGSEIINFGLFTTVPAYNISITHEGVRGYAWGSDAGWIVMNCADTTSGCTSTNENFKVAVSTEGILSGFAWGQKTGWINFGPFTHTDTPQVQITETGTFAGTNGSSAGYAWSQLYGWIVFDCSHSTTCVTTDYIPARAQPHNRTVVLGAAAPVPQQSQCSDGIDNDGNGYRDYPQDKNCRSIADNVEDATPSPSSLAPAPLPYSQTSAAHLSRGGGTITPVVNSSEPGTPPVSSPRLVPTTPPFSYCYSNYCSCTDTVFSPKRTK